MLDSMHGLQPSMSLSLTCPPLNPTATTPSWLGWVRKFDLMVEGCVIVR